MCNTKLDARFLSKYVVLASGATFADISIPDITSDSPVVVTRNYFPVAGTVYVMGTDVPTPGTLRVYLNRAVTNDESQMRFGVVYKP